MADAAGPRLLRPIPKERLRDGNPTSVPGDQSVGSPASASAGARARCESAEKMRALRNDNWHLMCELDILRRALESERSGRHAAQAPEGGSERSAGQDGGERAAAVGEGERETAAELRAQLQAERARVRDLETECRAWSALHQSVVASMPASGRGSMHVPRGDAGSGGDRGGDGDGAAAPQTHAAGPCSSPDTAGAKALFGTINRLIAAEESALQAQAPLIDVASVPGGAATSSEDGQGRLRRKNPRDWLHWKDKEEVSTCSISCGCPAIVCVGSRVAPFLYVYVYLYIFVHMGINMYAYTHTRACKHAHAHTRTLTMRSHARTCGGAVGQEWTKLLRERESEISDLKLQHKRSVCVCVFVCVCVRARVHAYANEYVSYTHTHTHTQTRRRPSQSRAGARHTRA